MAKDQDILDQVNKLVTEEQELRAQLQHREIDESEEHQRLRAVEVALDDAAGATGQAEVVVPQGGGCLLYTSPSPRDGLLSRMPSSA